jgi:hypothetical protein
LSGRIFRPTIDPSGLNPLMNRLSQARQDVRSLAALSTAVKQESRSEAILG